MDFTMGIIGLIGGCLCAIADILLDLKGRDNKKIGRYKIMDSSWTKMSKWRFSLSICVAAIAIPMYFIGIIAMKNQICNRDMLLGNAFWLSGIIGVTGGLFIHATLCYFPMIYKKFYAENKAQLAEEIISDIFNSIKVPFIVLYLLLTIVTSIIMIIALLENDLKIPYCFLILNPLGLTLIGIVLRKINPRVFYDLPGICMASLGLGMFGLAAALNTIL